MQTKRKQWFPQIKPSPPKNLLPERWAGDAFIAGGFAAHSGRASDIDMWVSVPFYNSLQEVRGELLAHLTDVGIDHEELPDGRESRPDMVLDEHYDTIFTTVKVAIAKGQQGGNASYHQFYKPIHLLVTNGDIKDVLNSFDITTHMIGIHPTLGIVKGDYWTPLDKMPKVHKMTPTTPARLKKIAARYADFRTARKLQKV